MKNNTPDHSIGQHHEQPRSREQKFISVVAYIHNSRAQLPLFLDTVMGCCSSVFSQCELILVDDASSDGSTAAVHEYYDAKGTDIGYIVSVVRLGAYHGLESAMNAGRDMAIGDYVYEFDDLYVDYDPAIIEEAYRKSLNGCDIVSVASDARTPVTSRLFYHIYNRASGTRHPLGQETFRLLSRRAINRVKSMGSYIPYRKAVYRNCGLSAETLVYQNKEGAGTRTLHSHKHERGGLAVDSFIFFTNVMERVALFISGIFLAIALLVIGYVIYSFFMDQELVSGWVSLMGFLSLGFMGIFGLLTIVLKYLSVIVGLIFRHQRYLIEDVEKIAQN